MNLETELDRTDRATLAAWQILNAAGWALAALAVAVGLHVLVDALTTSWLSECCGATSLTFDAVAGDETSTAGHLALRAGLSLGLGAVVGAVIGPRVATRPVAIATLVALAYAAMAVILVHPSGGVGSEIVTIEQTATGLVETRRVTGGTAWMLGYDLLIALTVPIATWTANRLAGHDREHPGS